MFSLESLHRSDSNEHTQHTIFSIKKRKKKKKKNTNKIIQNTIMSAAMFFFFLVSEERVRNSCGIRAILVRGTEVLLIKFL